MGQYSATRPIAVTSLALLIGLIGARIPHLLSGAPAFSWSGFLIGFGTVALAFLISRPIAKAANSNPPGTTLQRRLLGSGLLFFLATLVLFTAFIYTGWAWLKFPLGMAIVGGVICIFSGMVSALSATRHDA